MGTFVADFETTTNPDDCRVWAYAICEVGTEADVIVGNSLEGFMNWCRLQKDNHKIFFHNLKFDSQFIMVWLFKHGFQHVEDGEHKPSKSFSTLISDKGLYYQLEVVFERKGKRVNKVVFQDSLKLIPLSVEQIADSFKLPISKLKIDYARHNELPEGSPLTTEEIDYVKNDVRIVAYALDYFFQQGLTKMTIGGCALEEYKKLIQKKNFKRFYPPPQYDKDVRQSYKGGFTYLNPEFEGKVTGEGLVFDVNSLYPSVMYGCDDEYLPYGTPIFFQGKYQEDAIYPLYVQMIRCQFEVKKNMIPTIQIKHGYNFRGNEYLTSSDDIDVVLCLTNVDLELFLDHYDVYNLEYLSGWKFRGCKGNGLFGAYIDKWSGIKIQSKIDGNAGMYLIAKLFLNNLYGKFGTATTIKSKIPYLSEDDDTIHFRDSEPVEKDGVYIAMASFITSYARNKTIRAAQKIEDNYHCGNSKARFVYADTDSLHIVLNGEEKDEFIKNCGLKIDSTQLGYWDFESSFGSAKFLRQKCYIENHVISEEKYEEGIKGEHDYLYSKDKKGFYKLKITVAGMPKGCYPFVTFKNFKIGATYKGKLQPKRVPGGVVLNEVDFTIKEC